MAGPVAPWMLPGPLGPETDAAYIARRQREAAEQAVAAARASQGAFGSLGAPARPLTLAELEARGLRRPEPAAPVVARRFPVR